MLIAHYPLNGDATDYFGNGGTSTNVTWVDGKIGQAAEFNGNDGSILTGIPRAIFGNSWSVSLWCYFNEDDREVLASSWNSGGVAIEKDTRGRLRIYYNNSPDVHTDDNAVPINSWNHCVFIRDVEDNSFKIYIGGILVKRRVGIGGFDDVGLNNIRLGGDLRTGLVVLDGMLDDVRIYDHALSEKEVSEIARGAVVHYTFNSSDVSDSTGNFTPTVNTSSQDTSVYAVGSASGLFQNDVLSNDQVFLGSDPIFSISAWIRPDTYDNSGFWGLGSSSNAISCYTTTNLNPGFDDWGSTTYYANYTLPTDRFTHIVWIKKGTGEFNSSKLEIWINGELYPLIQNRFSSSTPNVSPGLSLGRIAYNNNSYHANGNVDDFRLYATALNSNDVQTLYKTGLSIDNIGNMHSKYLDESPKVRYIRDYLNGSTSNSGEHWVEIQANDTDGVNVALNASAYDAAGNSEPLLTDGNTNTSPYVSGNTYMEVDLGSVFLLDNVHIWHYYGDDRTYYDTKT